MATPAEISAAREKGFRNSLSHLKPEVVDAMAKTHAPMAARREKNVREFTEQIVNAKKGK